MSLSFLRAAQRSCSHCKQTGHNQLNCAQARLDITVMNQQIKNIVDRDAPVVEDGLSFYFNLKTVHELCILMQSIIRRMKPLIKLLVENRLITPEESNMRLKDNRIRVLMFYYWYTTDKFYEFNKPVKKLDILAQRFELETDLTTFDCPICTDCKPAKEKTVTNCNHAVCKTCIEQYFDHQLKTVNFPQPRCSLCRTGITTIAFANTDYIEEVSNKYFKVHVLI
jgi:hypothetical protein